MVREPGNGIHQGEGSFLMGETAHVTEHEVPGPEPQRRPHLVPRPAAGQVLRIDPVGNDRVREAPANRLPARGLTATTWSTMGARDSSRLRVHSPSPCATATQSFVRVRSTQSGSAPGSEISSTSQSSLPATALAPADLDRHSHAGKLLPVDLPSQDHAAEELDPLRIGVANQSGQPPVDSRRQHGPARVDHTQRAPRCEYAAASG